MSGDDVYGALEDINAALPARGDEHFPIEDGAFLAGLGAPAAELGDPWSWDGWTAGKLRTAVGQMAARFRTDPGKLLARAIQERGELQRQSREAVAQLEGRVRVLEGRVGLWAERQARQALLPDQPTLERVMRYESHLSRQMLQALHTLERLQKMRAGERVPAPAALDVTVSGEAADAGEEAPGRALKAIAAPGG